MENNLRITEILTHLSLAMVKPVRGQMGASAPVFAAAAEAALDLVAADGVSVSRIEPENGLVRTIYNGGVFLRDSPAFPEDEVYFIRDYPDLVRLLASGEPWAKAFADPHDPDPEAVLLRSVGQSAAAAVAIEVEGRTWGEIYVSRTQAVVFCSVEVASLRVLAAHIGALIALQAQAEEFAVSSQVDALTGLPLRGMAERAMAADRDCLTVAILDVDGLKRINDRFGHAAGDRLLQTVATELQALRRKLPAATVARLGGDEFLVVLPGEDVELCLPRLQAVIGAISAIEGAGLS
ncbi:MAG: GGDEF domain-containing protein [Angustibacter sp.]